MCSDESARIATAVPRQKPVKDDERRCLKVGTNRDNNGHRHCCRTEQELQGLTAGDRVRGQHEVLEDHRAAVVGRRGEVNPDPAGVRAGPQALLRDRGARPAA